VERHWQPARPWHGLGQRVVSTLSLSVRMLALLVFLYESSCNCSCKFARGGLPAPSSVFFLGDACCCPGVAQLGLHSMVTLLCGRAGPAGGVYRLQSTRAFTTTRAHQQLELARRPHTAVDASPPFLASATALRGGMDGTLKLWWVVPTTGCHIRPFRGQQGHTIELLWKDTREG